MGTGIPVPAIAHPLAKNIMPVQACRFTKIANACLPMPAKFPNIQGMPQSISEKSCPCLEIFGMGNARLARTCPFPSLVQTSFIIFQNRPRRKHHSLHSELIQVIPEDDISCFLGLFLKAGINHFAARYVQAYKFQDFVK